MDMTPGELLTMILESDRENQVRLCEGAVKASDAANECFLKGHVVEIENLRRTIVDLSLSLMASVRGGAVDPVVLRSAESAVSNMTIERV